MAPIYLGKRVVPSSLRYIENLANAVAPNIQKLDSGGVAVGGPRGTPAKKIVKV